MTILGSFSGTNGRAPNALAQGADGNLYGTTSYGGSGPCTIAGIAGCGTVFKITQAGALSSLHSFALTDGALPGGTFGHTLNQGSDGNLYGVTEQGGTGTGCSGLSSGCGTVFKITPNGTVATIYSFMGTPEGGNPMSAPIQAADGKLYGTTYDPGSVYVMTTAGSETPVFNFSSANNPQGSVPVGGLAQVPGGSFFGTTMSGGANGKGTVFSVTPAGNLTVVYSFGASASDGSAPRATLVLGGDGNFYGTTSSGGAVNSTCILGCGTIFRITPAGAFTTSHVFTGGADGSGAQQLVRGVDGNLYGITFVGSTSVLFQLTTAGTLTNIYTFSPTLPAGLIVQGSNGTFYGVTGGTGTAYPNGAIFSLTLGSGSSLTPSILPVGGIVSGTSFQAGISANAWITITGNNFSTVTDTWANAVVNGVLPTSLDGVSVRVGGAAAYVYYVSPTQINALAPNIGPGPSAVTVTTASGTSPAVMTAVQAVQPGFFQWGAYAVATRPDYSLAVKAGTFAGVTSAPAKPGDVIVLWGSGFGPSSPSAPVGVVTPSDTLYNTASPVTVTLGSVNATVYGAALAPGLAGLYQVAIQIPVSLSDGDYPVVATIADVSSPSTTLITVQH